MRKSYVLISQVPNILSLTVKTTKSAYYEHCKHYTTICEKRSDKTLDPMLPSTEPSVIYPAAIISDTGIKCRALLNTGSENIYASKAIIDPLKINPTRKK